MAFKYNINSYENLYTQFRENIERNTGLTNWNNDSIIRNITEPLVHELGRVNKETAAALDSLQLRKAGGSDLDDIAMIHGIDRKPPKRASSDIYDLNFYFYSGTTFGEINGGNNITVPKGTRVTLQSSMSGDSRVYVTTSAYTLKANESRGYCSLTSTSIGFKGNIAKHSLTSHNFTNYADSDVGSLKCINKFPINNGNDRERDKELRFSIFSKYSRLNVISKDAIAMKAINTPGVVRRKLVKNWFGLGTSALFVFGANNEVSASTVKFLQDKISQEIGITSRIIVTPGIRVYLDLDMTVWINRDINDKRRKFIKNEVARSISNFFARRGQEQVVDIIQIINTITSDVPAITGVSNRYDRSKIVEAAYVRKAYGTQLEVSSERIKLTKHKYELEENEFISLGLLNIKIEKN